MRFPEYAYRQSPQVQIPNPSAPNLPDAPPSGAVQLGGAIAGVGEAIGENALQRAKLENLVEQSRQAVQAAKLFTDLDAQAQELIRNPDVSMPASTYQKNMHDALQQTLSEGVKQFGDEKYRNAVLADGAIKIHDYGNKGWTAANTKLTDAMRADAHVQADENAKRYALTPDALQRLDLVTRTTDLYSGLANAGVFSQQEAQAAIEKFLRGAEHGDAVTQMQADPEGFRVKLGTMTTDAEGKTVYEYFPNLTTEQRFALSTNARVLAEVHEKKAKDAANDYNDAKESNFKLALRRGELSNEQLPALLEGMPASVVTNVLNYQDALTSREREATRFDQAQTEKAQREATDGILADIPLATEAEARAVVRRAEVALARGAIDEGNLTTIKAHVQAQIAYVRREFREDEADKERPLRKEYAAAVHEITAWLDVNIHDPSMKDLRDAYAVAQNNLKAVGGEAVLEGVSPREAMRRAVPETLIRLFGDLDSTEKEMWLRMGSVKGEVEYRAALLAGKITDPVQRTRMKEAWETLTVIQQLRGRPTATAAADQAGKAKKPFERRDILRFQAPELGAGEAGGTP